jgi:hypothetical protein
VEAQLSYSLNVLGNKYAKVDLSNKHRMIATDLAVAGIKSELTEKNENRVTVLVKQSDQLKVE